METSQTNATNVTLLLLGQAIWGHIWKRTVGKIKTNATNVTLHPFRQAIWGDTWECTVEKSQTNATNVTLHLLGHAIWGHTCYTKIPKNTGILFSKIPVSVFEFNPGIPVFSGIPQGPAYDSLIATDPSEAGEVFVKSWKVRNQMKPKNIVRVKTLISSQESGFWRGGETDLSNNVTKRKYNSNKKI